jgi:hypothetical protein
VVPAGHVAEHVGVAENGEVVPPVLTSAEVGATATEDSVGGGVVEIVIITGELCWGILNRLALTISPTVPGVVLAVNVT